MTLIEAMIAGKKIKRKPWAEFIAIDKEYISLPPGDILADDWETEPVTVSITREQFDAAWYQARITSPCSYDNLYQILVRELKLGETR